MVEVADTKTEGEMESTPIGSVLVVGAGVAGIRAALDLAEVGYRVLMTDASPAIGGILAKLDYQFRTIIVACARCSRWWGVSTLPSTACARVSFTTTSRLCPLPRWYPSRVTPGHSRCSCVRGLDMWIRTCASVRATVPMSVLIEAPDEFNQGLTRRKAIYQPVPHNLPNMWLIDMSLCDKCGKCVEVCPVDAIKLDAEDITQTVNVDSVIFATVPACTIRPRKRT